jgi:hypothetical protein
MPRKNHYDLLEIDPKADSKTIKRAYRRMVRLYHPDSGTSSVISQARFQEIIEAYHVLRDPVKRAQYDRIVSRPPVRIIESDWVYQPQARTTSPKPPRPKPASSSKPRPPAPAYQPQTKSVAKQIRQYAVFPILLGMAALVLFGVIQVTEALVQPETESIVTARATVEEVQAYACDGNTCYYVTYSYFANGQRFQNSFSTASDLYVGGTSIIIQYYLSNPSTSIYTPPDAGNDNTIRYAALVGFIALLVMGGLYVSRRAILHNQDSSS